MENNISAPKKIVVILVGAVLLVGGGFYWGKNYEKNHSTSLGNENEEVISEADQGLDSQRIMQPDIEATYLCEDGKSIYAGFNKEGIVHLALSDGREVTLEQTISASGARYANEGQTFIFWNKGNTAFIEEDGVQTFTGCATE